MTEENKIPDLAEAGLLSSEGEIREVQDPVVEMISSSLQSLEQSLAALHVSTRVLSNRMASLEGYVSYLLSKDPEVGPKLKEAMEQAQAKQNTAE